MSAGARLVSQRSNKYIEVRKQRGNDQNNPTTDNNEKQLTQHCSGGHATALAAPRAETTGPLESNACRGGPRGLLLQGVAGRDISGVTHGGIATQFPEARVQAVA